MARGPVADIGASIAEADRLRRAGALPQALQVLGRAVDLTRNVPGADRVEVYTVRRMLAEVMCEMGDRDGACEVLTELLADAQASLGPRHPLSVRTIAVLAAVVHELGDFDSAERLYREVGERLGDRESRAASLVRVRLALLQRDRGDLDAAREGLAEAYQKHKEAFGGDDAETATIAAQLAELHRDAGDSAAARRLLTVAYVATCSSLGEDHEVTKRLETDLEALEPPMPSAPVDLPEDSQSTRSIKRRHSKKGVPAASAASAAAASPPVAPPVPPVVPPVPPVVPPVPPVAPPVPPAAPAGVWPPAPAAQPRAAAPLPAPVSPPYAAMPTRGSPPPAAMPARAGALGMPTAPTSPARPVQIPAQRPMAGPGPEFSGRRTHPGYGDPLSPGRLGALTEAETVITGPVVIDPIPRPPARPKRGAAATVLVVLMVLVAIGGGIALAVIGATMQS